MLREECSSFKLDGTKRCFSKSVLQVLLAYAISVAGVPSPKIPLPGFHFVGRLRILQCLKQAVLDPRKTRLEGESLPFVDLREIKGYTVL